MSKLKIFRPKKVEVEIFGKNYTLRRLSRGDVIDVVTALIAEYQKTGGNVVKFLSMEAEKRKEIIASLSGVLDILFKASFPDFEEWDELDINAELQLFELIWTENNLQGVIENFSRMAK
jgi:hypothetical protein